MDGVLDFWEGEYTYRCILTNDYDSSVREIVEFYNLREGKEQLNVWQRLIFSIIQMVTPSLLN